VPVVTIAGVATGTTGKVRSDSGTCMTELARHLIHDPGYMTMAYVAGHPDSLALSQHGMEVPGEIAVTGFDDIPVARRLSPQLTIVRQPLAELGATAFELLRSVIGNGEPAENEIVLPTRLMRSASGAYPSVSALTAHLARPTLLKRSDSAASAEPDARADRPPGGDIAVPGQRPAPADWPEGVRR
jgi:hypothetical protein